jgi:hypothetical protein
VPAICLLFALGGCADAPRTAALDAVPSAPVPPPVSTPPPVAPLPEGAVLGIEALLERVRQRAPTAEAVSAMRAAAMPALRPPPS